MGSGALGLVATTLAVLAVGGCGNRGLATNDPAKVCASPETTERIRGLLFEKAAAGAPSSNRYAIPKLQPQTKVSLNRPLVESYDTSTHRTNCTAVLGVGLPAGVMTVGGLRVPVRYNAQPLADGSGVSFDLTGADEVVAAIAGADLTVWARSNAQAEPGLVVEYAAGASPAERNAGVSAMTPRAAAMARPERAGPITVAEQTAKPPPAVAPLPAPPSAPSAQRAPAQVQAAKRPPPPAPHPAPVVAAQAAPPPQPKSRPTPPLTQAPPPPPQTARVAPAPRPQRPELAQAYSEPPFRAPVPPPQSLSLRDARNAPPLYAGAGGPVRVFVHVSGGGRGEADAVRQRLGDLVIRGAPVSTPAVRVVARTPRRNEVRCLKAADCVTARRVAAYLARSLPGGVTVVDMSRTYETDPGVRRGSLELWLRPPGAGSAPPPDYGPEEDEEDQ